MSEKVASKEEQLYCRLTRLFATVVLVLVISVSCIEALVHITPLQNRVDYGTVLILAVSLTLGLCDLKRYRRRAEPHELLLFYRNPHYWCLVLAICSVLVFALTPRINVVRAREPVPKPTPVKEPAIPCFPPLAVSAVVINGERSSAIIDGSVVLVGEDIHGVVLLQVTESSIVVGSNSFTKEIAVGQSKAIAEHP